MHVWLTRNPPRSQPHFIICHVYWLHWGFLSYHMFFWNFVHALHSIQLNHLYHVLNAFKNTWKTGFLYCLFEKYVPCMFIFFFFLLILISSVFMLKYGPQACLILHKNRVRCPLQLWCVQCCTCSFYKGNNVFSCKNVAKKPAFLCVVMCVNS